MGVASLVLGILGFLVFSWLGPLLGFTWSGALMAGAAVKGDPHVIIWPVWFLGLFVGVGFSLIPVVLGALSLKKEPQSKGVGLAGLIVGSIAALGGVVITLVFSFSITATAAALSGKIFDDPQAKQQLKDFQKQLSDPALQKEIQEQLKKAAEKWRDMQQQNTVPKEPEPMQPVPAPPAQPAPPVQPAQPAPAPSTPKL